MILKTFVMVRGELEICVHYFVKFLYFINLNKISFLLKKKIRERKKFSLLCDVVNVDVREQINEH